MSALIHIREKLMNRKHNVIVFNALHTLFILCSYLSIPRVYGKISCQQISSSHQTCLARIIDLQICAWLKQVPIESERIASWIQTHRDVLQFHRKIQSISNASLIHLFLADFNESRAGNECARTTLKIAGEVLLYAALAPIIEQQMVKTNLWGYYRTTEMPALTISLQMLLNGVLINNEELTNAREELIVIDLLESISIQNSHLDFNESIGIASLSYG